MKLEWLVPVIVVIVYAIGWIIKAKEEIDAKAKKPVGKAPGQELDRFLQEIDRLRKQNEAAPTPVARRDDDGEISQPVLIRPVAKPAPKPPQPKATPKPRPLPAAPSPVFAVTQPEDRPRPGMMQSAAGKPGAAGPAFDTRSASVAGVLSLLRNPRTISTAMILNEILGPPKSRR